MDKLENEFYKMRKNAKGLLKLAKQEFNFNNKNINTELLYFSYYASDRSITWDMDADGTSQIDENYDLYFFSEILYNYIGMRNYDFNEIGGRIYYHSNFKLTLSLDHGTNSPEWDFEKNQFIDLDEDEHLIGIEYEITDSGIFTIEYGTTNKFIELLNKSI